uniref:Uncharacterized protein n=1 Tax=Candidatus Kentrum sp. MB TaxID=2138164 RepID=A0A450XS11_9GAMM|nr:MAG: hypothetical protein BECKMB1821G_GA0114241_110114 [Candidatus Kentron sp. MB]VFK35131.1 MAG: hypothetical protein BECKMB1821I_GA0114274_110115 [Candidatus Kentron sp. MB]VFK76993.1 MAG: hypothetical protein BECKMB1821H_GA0114242_108815 [Candidatus Kentron sp. MB]
MYEVLLERRAEKDLRRLPADVFQRVIAAIAALAGDPRPEGSRKLTGSQPGKSGTKKVDERVHFLSFWNFLIVLSRIFRESD